MEPSTGSREDPESAAPWRRGCGRGPGPVVGGGLSDPCLAQVGNLKAHLKIHIADGPLKCRECGKQFTTSGRARLPPTLHPVAPTLLPHARPSARLHREPQAAPSDPQRGEALRVQPLPAAVR